MTFEELIRTLENRRDISYTPEQIDLIQNFNDSLFCFADPGTGKTDTVCTGLLAAELVFGYDGRKINACSFTNEATNELKERYHNIAKKLGHRRSKVDFRTLDSLCAKIVRENYLVLYENMKYRPTEFKIIGNTNYQESIEDLEGCCEELGINLMDWQYRTVRQAIIKLNSKMVFDEGAIETSEEFVNTKLPIETFKEIRKWMYNFYKNVDQCPMEYIQLYALEILMRSEEVRKDYNNKFDLFIVDEAQDLNLVKLRILRLIANKLIVVGDMKQQIFGFNGACSEIVAKYAEYYPDHKTFKLTKSWRCANEIVEFSKGLIKQNEMGGESFTGIDREDSLVRIHDTWLYKDIIGKVADEYYGNDMSFPRSHLFIFRNNFSSVPIIDELYRQRVPMVMLGKEHSKGYKLSGYTRVTELPIIRDLVALVSLCMYPNDVDELYILTKVIPEFKSYKNDIKKLPLYKIMKSPGNVGKSLTDLPEYNFKDPKITELFYRTLKNTKELLDRKDPAAPAKDVLNSVYFLYNYGYLKENQKYIENTPEYFFNLARPIIESKTYEQFLRDERDKEQWVIDSSKKGEGVRCLTSHSAKGKEAKVVHIVDAERGIFPNDKKLNETVEKGCLIDAARNIRNERSLVFVAATRAMQELHIYAKELSPLFDENNEEYKMLDDAYKNYKDSYRDIEAFKEMAIGS